MTLYPGAAEAIIWRESAAEPAPADDRDAVRAARAPDAADAGEAAAQHRERTGRRAKGRVRRYAVANDCTRLFTFTYAPDSQGERPTDRRRVKRDWAILARELKRRWPELAWVRVLERHKDGHLHVHAGLSRPLPKPLVARLWGHGHVDARKIRTKRGGREDARGAARYLAKYATKARETDPGEHGYEVAQGHAPEVVRLRAWDRDGGRVEAIRAMWGEVPAYEWDSGSSEEWTGPPVAFLGW